MQDCPQARQYNVIIQKRLGDNLTPLPIAIVQLSSARSQSCTQLTHVRWYMNASVLHVTSAERFSNSTSRVRCSAVSCAYTAATHRQVKRA
jgi:hypothetical protein